MPHETTEPVSAVQAGWTDEREDPSPPTFDGLLACPGCDGAFEPKRSNQRYCSRPCQKAASNNATRGPRRITDSPEARRIHEARRGRIRGLSDALYETHPAYRAEFLERLIAEGRKNAELRRLVTAREWLRCWDRDEGTGRLHISHVLDHFCQNVYGQRSYVVLDPATDLPDEADLAFPAVYFGPDAPPVYEDGRLKRRPCPWATRGEKSALHHYKGNFKGNPMVKRDPVSFLAHLKGLRAGTTTREAA